jgi:hypothetical protein
MRFQFNTTFISRLMVVMMLFVSLSPAVSHALVSWTGNASFAQKICTSDGKKLVIQVKTTMGKQLSTELNLKSTVNSETDDRHVAHCAFCSSPQTQDVLPVPASSLIIQVLESQAWQVAVSAVIPVYQRFELSPPSQAPPNS